MAEFFVTSSHFALLASYCILAASFSKRFILKLFAFAKYSNSFVTKLAHSKHLSKLVNSVKCGIIYSVFQRLFLLKYNTFSFHSQADVTCEKVHDGGSTCNYDNETILMSFMSATWYTNLKNLELITYLHSSSHDYQFRFLMKSLVFLTCSL